MTLLQPLVILIIVVSVVKSEFLVDTCDMKNSYTTNSKYQANLRQLQSSLVSSIIPSGFSNYTVGNNSEQVFGLAFCRGDVSAEGCQTCLRSTINEVSTRCPYGKEEIIWFDQCFLRYSNTNFFSIRGRVLYGYCNLNEVVNPPQYNTILAQLMNTLITQAVNHSNQMFAAGFTNVASPSNKLYGLVHCTQDLSRDDCYLCLQEFVKAIPDYCYGKFGGRLLGTSCGIRYESYKFYNNTAVPNEGNSGKSILF
ncbi:cysteine-rich repeat secretory protein 38-like protein [Carex littledalei]|uniref:Cysteine-rich repeat secretory protein 38-like protein n=1 Tax=Carex littledalei TaxID=544730 RepID=A0A833RDQ1_9POAL|nr:cysteine-rich repeat secretory protein 38-like protein [Carex littledalei]